MTTTAYTVVALMHQDRPCRTYEVAVRESDGALVSRARGARKWDVVHSQLSPTLDVYLRRCEDNFGWTSERV